MANIVRLTVIFEGRETPVDYYIEVTQDCSNKELVEMLTSLTKFGKFKVETPGGAAYINLVKVLSMTAEMVVEL